jgi:raffinose/stachyose/melibiose transport system substrate-binding protein
MRTPRSRRVMLATAIALAAITPLAACAGGSSGESGGSGGGASGTDPESFTVMTANENATLEDLLTQLSEGACKAENEALPLEHQKVAQADTVQKVTLLASQDALPAHTIAGTALIRPDGDLGAGGLVQDLEETGAAEYILPAAASTEENVYGGVVSMPYQYNIEGFWYNKEIFEEEGIEVPTTWEDFLAVADQLQQAGVQPLTTAGASGFPLTRLIGMYTYRTVGPDAMEAIRDGDAKLTDEDYVAGAQALADLADAGYFGEGFSTRDGDTSTNQFLTGQAAITYDGSWLLGAINDPERNEIGAENVGFFPFPDVEGGEGSIDQYPANAGAPMIISSKQYGPKVADWVTCIAENYGALALNEAGIISGFEVNEDVTDISPNTAAVQDIISGIDAETVLWFEALFDPKSNSLASTNVTLLTTGQMSAEDYMADLQESIDANG